MRYVRPHDLADAVAQVAAGAVPLAGGSVVVPSLARGAPEPATVVDVGRLEALRELTVDDAEIVVGAAVTLERLEGLDVAGEAALPEAAAGIGNPLVRRVGTVGGNVASGLETADLVPALLALDAEAVWQGPDGEEREPVVDALSRAGAGGRLLTAIRIARDPSRRSGFAKFAWRRATGTPVATVALAARRGNGVIVEPRLAAGGFVDPGRLAETEALLDGRPWDDALDDVVAAAVSEVARRARLDPADLRPRLVGLGLRRLVARLGAS